MSSWTNSVGERQLDINKRHGAELAGGLTTSSVHVSALRGPDGRFAALDIRTSPESVKLAAGERAPVTLIADISDALVAGADYHGEINVPGLSSRGIPLIVRRRAS